MFNTTTTGPNLQQVLKEAQQELNAEKLVKAVSQYMNFPGINSSPTVFSTVL